MSSELDIDESGLGQGTRAVGERTVWPQSIPRARTVPVALWQGCPWASTFILQERTPHPPRNLHSRGVSGCQTHWTRTDSTRSRLGRAQPRPDLPQVKVSAREEGRLQPSPASPPAQDEASA